MTITGHSRTQSEVLDLAEVSLESLQVPVRGDRDQQPTGQYVQLFQVGEQPVDTDFNSRSVGLLLLRVIAWAPSRRSAGSLADSGQAILASAGFEYEASLFDITDEDGLVGVAREYSFTR